MQTIMIIFGTRPEAIKMAPLVTELSHRKNCRPLLCVSGQHRRMLDEVLCAFAMRPDYDLNIMRENQSPVGVTARILEALEPILRDTRPDTVLVHGDTATAQAAALCAFLTGIPIGHVEAGLRTYDMRHPFPEEFNRRAISLVARWHFAPTEEAASNLRREGVCRDNIFVTGNTVVDALRCTVRPDFSHPLLSWAEGRRLILLTTHRRESIGPTMRGMLSAVARVASEHTDIAILCPLHPNPAVRSVAGQVLSGIPNLRITDPLGVTEFHNLLARSFLVLTDSGGVQEEAASLGIPALVLRDKTERPEGIRAGALRLTGTAEEDVYRNFLLLLKDPKIYRHMAETTHPYGDGRAAVRIADILLGEQICGVRDKEPNGNPVVQE